MPMIRIAVIDDEKNILDAVGDCIKASIDLPDLVELDTFSGAESFLGEIEKGIKYDILLTDIELAGMNGVELGKQVLKRQPGIYLIFLTSHSEFAIDSYVMEAYQYILKQDMKSRLPPILNRLIGKIQAEHNSYIYIGTTNSKQKIYYNEIISISKHKKGGKYVLLVTTKGEFQERTTLNELVQRLKSKEFVMIARDYIVNMKHIDRVTRNTIYLDNTTHVTISRGKLSKVKEQINTYWREM